MLDRFSAVSDRGYRCAARAPRSARGARALPCVAARADCSETSAELFRSSHAVFFAVVPPLCWRNDEPITLRQRSAPPATLCVALRAGGATDVLDEGDCFSAVSDRGYRCAARAPRSARGARALPCVAARADCSETSAELFRSSHAVFFAVVPPLCWRNDEPITLRQRSAPPATLCVALRAGGATDVLDEGDCLCAVSDCGHRCAARAPRSALGDQMIQSSSVPVALLMRSSEWLAETMLFAGTLSVRKTLPPMVESRPMMVVPPRIVALA